MYPMETFRRVSGWLCDVAMSQVSLLAVLHLFVTDPLNLEHCRFDLNPTMLMVGPMDPTGTFRNVFGWLHNAGMSAVSGFVPLCYFVIQMLDLHLYRSDLDSSASPPWSVALQAMFRNVAVWLRSAHVFEVCCFNFLHLADFYRFELEPSASTAPFNVSVRVLRMLDRWPR